MHVLLTRECLNGTVVNSPDPEVKCPFSDGDYECGAPISEREIKAVSPPSEGVFFFLLLLLFYCGNIC